MTTRNLNQTFKRLPSKKTWGFLRDYLQRSGGHSKFGFENFLAQQAQNGNSEARSVLNAISAAGLGAKEYFQEICAYAQTR